jgi:hypothetical protein
LQRRKPKRLRDRGATKEEQTKVLSQGSKGKSSSYAQTAELILGVLAASPLLVWVNPSSFSQYLERRLPEYVEGGKLQLEPIWQAISRIPGVQKAAMEVFFGELLRQEMPWPMVAPLAMGGGLHEPMDEQKLQQCIAQMVAQMEGSTLSKTLPPERFRRYLERRLPEYIRDGLLDLRPLETILRKSLDTDPAALEAYFRRLQRHPLPWPLRQDTPQEKTTAPIKRPLPTAPSSAPSASASSSSTQRTPQRAAPAPASQALSSRPSATVEKADPALQAAIRTILKVLETSPLAVYLRSGSFQSYLQRWLPEYTRQGYLDTEPIWEHLSQIPSLRVDVLRAFFEELLRQEMPWPMRPPPALEAIQQRKTSTTRVRSLRPPDEHYLGDAPLKQAEPSVSSWQEGTSYDSLLSALGTEVALALDDIEVVTTGSSNSQHDPNRAIREIKEKARESAAAHQNPKIRDTSSQHQPRPQSQNALSSFSRTSADLDFAEPERIQRRSMTSILPTIAASLSEKTETWPWQRIAIALWGGVFAVFVIFLAWFALRPPNYGIAVEHEVYQNYLPVKQAYIYQYTLSLVLDPRHQMLWERQTLQKQIPRMYRLLQRKQIQTLRVFSSRHERPHRLLFSMSIPTQPVKSEEEEQNKSEEEEQKSPQKPRAPTLTKPD